MKGIDVLSGQASIASIPYMKIPEAPFRVLHDCILTECLQKNETSILLPGGVQPDSIFGFFVVAIGPGRKSEFGQEMKSADVAIGDEIILNGNGAGYKFTHPATGDRKFAILRPLDILAVLKPEYSKSAEMNALFGPAQ